MNLNRYAPARRQVIDGETKYVRLADEPMHVNEVTRWLEREGFVKRVPSDDPDGSGYVLTGWGTDFFAVPFDQTLPPGSGMPRMMTSDTTWRGRWRQTARPDGRVVYHYRVGTATYVRVPWLAWAMFS